MLYRKAMIVESAVSKMMSTTAIIVATEIALGNAAYLSTSKKFGSPASVAITSLTCVNTAIWFNVCQTTAAATTIMIPIATDSRKPFVILTLGVNGVGKTTTIAKMAGIYRNAGKKVLFGACDTFRAAAIEQLNIWAERTGADIVSTKLGADAAGLAYEAYEKARTSGHDVLIIDTAGRLQNKTELMAELEKIVRVLGKQDLCWIDAAQIRPLAEGKSEAPDSLRRISGM